MERTKAGGDGEEILPAQTTLLLRGVRRGERASLEHLLERELPWVRDVAHRRLGSRRSLDDTGDIVQEVALRALTRGPGLELASRSHLQALLAKMVVNHIRSRAKASRCRPLPAAGGEVILDVDAGRASSTLTPPEAAARAEDVAWCWLAIEFLPEIDQDIVQLRLVEDLTFPAIGANLGMTEDATRRRFDRSLPKLRAILRDLRAGKLGELLRADEATETRS